MLSNEYKMTDYKFSRPYISPQLDKQLDDRQRTALLSPEGLDCSKEKEHPILGKNGKPLTCILRIDPRSNSGSTISRSNAVRSRKSRSRSRSIKPRQRRSRLRSGSGPRPQTLIRPCDGNPR